MPAAQRVMSVTTRPWAECVGPDDHTPCHLDWSSDHPADARARAKQHATDNPGHRTRVVTETIDLYQAEAD